MKKQRNSKDREQTYLLCCDILPGLKSFAYSEVRSRYRHHVTIYESDEQDAFYMDYTGDLRNLFSLRTVVAVSLVVRFPIPRPRAFLGHQYYHILLEKIQEVRSLHAPGIFMNMRISAAGANSSVFVALQRQLSMDTGLPYDAESGDFLLRIRPVQFETGWEVLLRLTPRPLSTRAWRLFNMRGALNATIAAAMIEMTIPQAEDRFLNLMCGSGTLLVERLKRSSAAVAVGCDTNLEALRGAQINVQAAGVANNILLFASDATDLPFLPGTFNALCADVPWGQSIGSHEGNQELYPQLLSEAARLAAKSAKFIVLTHEIMLFETVLQQFQSAWTVENVAKVFQGGLHPRIYLLRKHEV